MHHGSQRVIARADLDQLLAAIARRGFRLIGPTVRDGAIVYDDISTSADLPAGWTDDQDGGSYRLQRGRITRCSGTPSARSRRKGTFSRPTA